MRTSALSPDGQDLAHFNIAIAKHPLDHPLMAGFASQIEAVNAIAEASPGFVWTPADGEAGDAAAVFGSALVLANMSTWRSVEQLRQFVYGGRHGRSLRQRSEWFEPASGPAYVLWWVPAGHRPNWIEARQRLEALQARGPSKFAFNFSAAFSAAGDPIGGICSPAPR